MSDLLRAVTFDVGGRPQLVVDLNDMVDYGLVGDSFALQPATEQRVMASGERAYAGSRQTGRTHENAVYSWQHLVRGATVDEVLANVTALVSLLERVPAGDLFIESRLDGATYATYREVRATGIWQPTYSWHQLSGARSMVVSAQIQVDPLARALRMDVYEDFATDTRDEYTYDAGIASSEQVSGGVLLGAGTLTTERRAIHTARGYDIVYNRQSVKATPGTTITAFKAGRVIKRISATTYLEGYVDDTGTVSRVRLDKVVAGVRANLASTDLAARVVAGRPFWVRTTILGNAVTVEHFTTAPGPLTVATTIAGTRTQTLAGGDATQFGAGVIGGYGRVWIPQHAAASLDEEYATPHWSGTLTTPAVVQWGTPIPGDAPALCDATVTHSGGSANPIWALLGWTRRPGTGLAPAPFGILEAETAGNVSGWSVVGSDATMRGSSSLKDTAASASDVYAASWELDPSLLLADDFDREVSIEVWADVVLSSTLISPTLTLSLRPEDGLSFGAARPTDEWGQAGKVLTVPSSGSAVKRFVRLGTLHLLVDPLRPRKWLLWLAGAVGAGSFGNFGIDYLVLVLSRQRACSRSGVADDSGYPDFLSTTAEVSKTIRSDLSALIAAPGKWGHPDHGLGGQLLELPPGNVDTLLKLSSLVPDDPTVSSASEQLSHTAGIALSVTPRYYAFRT